MTLRAALVQVEARAGDVPGNLARIEAALRGLEADLVVLPELVLPGYGAGEAFATLAEPVDGPQVAALGALARAGGFTLVAGFAEQAEGRVWNSAVLTDGRGAPTVYRKSHLYGDYERTHFTPGPPAAVTAPVGGLRVGLLICYDVEFPENARRLARAGADVIAVPTALPAGPHSQFICDHMIPVRAFENQVFVVYADLCGADSRFAYHGQSRIAAPDGSLLSGAGDAPTRLTTIIDPARFADSRDANAYLRDLNP